MRSAPFPALSSAATVRPAATARNAPATTAAHWVIFFIRVSSALDPASAHLGLDRSTLAAFKSRAGPSGGIAMFNVRVTVVPLLTASLALAAPPGREGRPRARDIGVAPGVFPPGPLDAITDVPGVAVGHATRIEGDRVRTGVTAI